MRLSTPFCSVGLLILLATAGTGACWRFDFTDLPNETSGDATPDRTGDATAESSADARSSDVECTSTRPLFRTDFLDAGSADWLESAQPGQIRYDDGGGIRISVSDPWTATTLHRPFEGLRDYAVRFEFRIVDLKPSDIPDGTLRLQQLTSSDNTYNVALFRAPEGWSVLSMLVADPLFRNRSDPSGLLDHVVAYRVQPADDGGTGGSIQVSFDGIAGPRVPGFPKLPVRGLQIGPGWVGQPPVPSTVTVVYKNVSLWDCSRR